MRPLLLVCFLLVGCVPSDGTSGAGRCVLRLAVTTSTADSGLLDVVLPPFERQHDVRIDVLALGTGAALRLGEQGEVDAVLVHALEAELAFMESGFGCRREGLMVNRFHLLAPPGDPATVAGMEVVDALQQIAAQGQPFLSRGDASGTHQREQALWNQGGGRPRWAGYLESGQGMGRSLTMADELGAYILTDRGTYLKFQSKVDLVPVEAPSESLENPYGYLVVNPARHPHVRAELARALADYLIAPETQRSIAAYKIGGQTLFEPLRLVAP